MDDLMGALSPTEAERARRATQAHPYRRPRLEALRHRVGAWRDELVRWQADIPDQGRVTLVGLLLLGLGLTLQAGLPAGLMASSVVLVLVGLGFDFRHYLTATALVIAAAIVIVVAIVRAT